MRSIHTQRSRCNHVVKILAVLLVFFMMFTGLQQMLPQAKADTSIIQDTDKDFKAGALSPSVEVNGTGPAAALKLARSINWRQANPKNNPGHLDFPMMAYDPDNGLTVLFGGVDGSGVYHDQTWIYNATNMTWYNANPTGTPVKRYAGGMVYDPKDKVFILYGGATTGSNPLQDTWSYNITNNTWSKKANGPPKEYELGLIYDPVTTKVALYGGWNGAAGSDQVWLYNYTKDQWVSQGAQPALPGARDAFAYAYNPINKTYMIFGGYYGGNYVNDTYYYNVSGNSWTKVNYKGYMPPLWGSSMVWDSTQKLMFLYGGYNAAIWNYDNSTYTFNPVTNTWKRVTPPLDPGRGDAFGMAYNVKEKIIVLFGGYMSSGGYSNMTWYFGNLYADSGTFTSGTIDSEPTQTYVNWVDMSISAKLYGGSITYAVSANDDNITWYYVGWDGTVNTKYTQLGGQPLWSGLDGHRYLRYSMVIKDADPLISPVVDNVTVRFNRLPFAPVLKAPTHLRIVTTDTPSFTLASQDLDLNDRMSYSLELSMDNFNTVNRTYDMTLGSPGWSKAGYAPGEDATFTIPASEKLLNGKTYQWRVSAFDGRDWSPVSVVWWFSVDITPPEAPYSVSDGLGNDIDFTNSMDTLSAHWDSAGDAESGIVAYWYAIGNTSGGHEVLNYTNNGIRTAVTVHGLKLASGTRYYYSVKAQNGAGLFSTVVSSNGVTVDTSAPTVPIVKDSGDYTNSKSELSAQWFSTDPESGVSLNMYAIGTTAGATDVVSWTSIGGANQITHSGLKLVEGTTYYFSVKSQNSVGNWSQVGASDGITVDFTPPNEVTLNISGTNGYTSSDKVVLTIGAKDKVSGVGDMEFSNDGSIWSSWVPYAKTQDWTLSPGDGLKTVYLRVKDKAQNEGAVVKATVTFDTMPPTDTALVINDNANMTKNLAVTLKVSAKDATSGVSQMAFSDDGVVWTAWEPYASTKAWNLKGEGGQKAVWVRVMDKAGNIAPGAKASITYGEGPVTLSIVNPVRTATVSGTVHASGTVISDTPVTSVQVRVDGGVWKDASGTNNWTFDWNTKDYPDGIHNVQVQAKDTFGYTASNPTEVRVKNAPSKVSLSTGDVLNYLILGILIVLIVVIILFYVLARRIRKPPMTEHTEPEHEEYEAAPQRPRAPPRQTAPSGPVNRPQRTAPTMAASTTAAEQAPVEEEVPEVAMDAPTQKPGPPVDETKPDLVQQHSETEAPVKDEGHAPKKEDDSSLMSILDKLDK